MIIWIAIGLLTAATIAALAWPLLRETGRAADRRDYGLTVYRAQLKEIERDLASGVLSEDQAAAARVEIQRRMLAEDRQQGAVGPGAVPPHYRAFALALAAGIVPLGSVLIYLTLGSPGAPDMPLASRQAEIQAVAQSSAALTGEVQALRTRLEENPADRPSWLRLGNALRQMERFEESAEAYRRAAHLEADPESFGLYAEMLVQAQQGIVPVEARTVFEHVLASSPGDPRSLYYLGLAAEQAGQPRAALENWARLQVISPPDAPWMTMLTARMESLAAENGIALAPLREAARQEMGQMAGQRGGETPAAGPSRADVEAAQQMSPEERAAFVQGMVERLAERLKDQPKDEDGWIRLTRAYGVQGEPEKARAAYEEALTHFPDSVPLLTGYAMALFPPGTPEAEMPEEFMAVMRKLNALDATNPQALFFLGNEAARKGDTATARRLWTELREMAPADSPLREQIDRRIEALPN
ncbi:c-type cytochrome biogenesis protein CcmI [Oceanibaculum indicum]|uniref:Cytochrome c-type biogenesis protein cycH n=1 Tax=Oceanibaculum indicum P24 TaxID=1207063 RepID=K2JUJ1_9PROT|nr:c-type cytochrome biogenesis protein CcmI [Oceanibaculum indicum]EKE78147.1 Cytochrome c-type biogenesis protein cycH [Oceanibaculum indicum P24]